MTRRILAAAVLLALSWLIAAPVWAGGRSSCAMCARHCCCAPKPGGDRCSLRRACGAEVPADLAAASGYGKPALMPVRSVVGPPSGDEAIVAAAAPTTLRLSLAPPDPPPRAAA